MSVWKQQDEKNQTMNRYLAGAVAWALVAWAALAAPAAVNALERLGAVTLDTGENGLVPSVIDPAGDFAYFGTDTEPGQVVKVDLESLERVDAITLEEGEDQLFAAVIDPAGEFAYFGTGTSPGQVVKIDLETFERVDAITLEEGEDTLVSAAIDPAGQFAYFGMNALVGHVVKIDLETFERVGVVTLEEGEDGVYSAVVDPAGEFAYVGTFTPFSEGPERVIKIDLGTFERVDTILLEDDVSGLLEAVIDPAGRYAYFGTFDVPGQVLKIDLETFELVDALTLEEGENDLDVAVIDATGDFAYFGASTAPGRVVAIDLDTFERVDAITLEAGEEDLVSGVIDPARHLAYFGTYTEPGQVVKVLLQPLSPATLEVDFTSDSSDGNGIFEPGEQAEVAPGWRNNHPTDDAFADGILSGFTGPDGASYDIVTNGVGFGPVAPGEVGRCRDSEGGCYQLDVQMTGPERPAVHWDATVDEEVQIGPDDFVTHTWSLHLGDSFSDVPRTSVFYTTIEGLLHSGVTGGCGDGEYCPGNVVTRAQMSSFVLKASLGPAYSPQPCAEGDETFDDVPFDHLFCPWIEALARREVVSGCGADNYCPSDAVTRAQMAIFLLKTLEGADYSPPECSNRFDDVPCPSLFADWIEDLAAREITSGCSETNYCPSDPVTRGQMAALQAKTFGLLANAP